jgi:hypothetical protein
MSLLKQLCRRSVAVAVTLLLVPQAGWAMPNFAREYDKNCGMCHTQVPNLNKTGYEFRLAGFRLPDEIGQEEKEKDFDFGDTIAARMQMRLDYSKHNDVNAANDTSDSQATYFETTLYPLTASWGGYFGSTTEISWEPDGILEMENAYVRGVYGDPSGWFQGRVGIMHAWEGYGASDRPFSINRPLFQKQKAAGSPFFLWSVDEVAAEGGYYFAKSGTNVTARVGNGIVWEEGSAAPAQGGELTKRPDAPARQAKSYQAVITQMLGDAAGVTLYYYTTEIPTPDTTDPGNTAFTVDKLSRLALYANYYVVPKMLNLAVGYGSGKDNIRDENADPGAVNADPIPASAKSKGYYVEADYFPIEHRLATGVRYDVFDPSDQVDANEVSQVALFGNYSVYRGLQLLGEYDRKTSEKGAAGDNKDDTFQVRLIFIW